MHTLAASKGGKCISTVYIDNRTPLKWKCNNGHTWKDTYPHIMRNQNFCQYCKKEEQLAIKKRKHRQKKSRPFKMRGGLIDE